jgi:hypothetical protein
VLSESESSPPARGKFREGSTTIEADPNTLQNERDPCWLHARFSTTYHNGSHFLEKSLGIRQACKDLYKFSRTQQILYYKIFLGGPAQAERQRGTHFAIRLENFNDATNGKAHPLDHDILFDFKSSEVEL